MNLKQQANLLIPVCDKKSSVKVSDGTTGDIMNVVLDCYRKKNNQVKKFAPYLAGRSVKETCSNVWHFVKDNIAYKVDPPGEQWIKEPARVWADKVCDCKSYSVFIASCLHHLGIDGIFRFVSFAADQIPTHVYVVVPTKNERIILDCVIGDFNKEKPFTRKYDYSMTRISQLSGVPGSNSSLDRSKKLREITAARIAEAKRSNDGSITGQRNAFYQKLVNDLYSVGVSGIGETSATTFPTEKQSAIDTISSLADYTHTLANGLKVAPDLFKALFTKGGVSPSFFNTFPFLTFLDNSTNHWKSRWAKMQNWDPNQTIAWYINELNQKGNAYDAVQYCELYGTRADHRSDVGKVSYVNAKMFNDYVQYMICDGNLEKAVPNSVYQGKHLMNDLTKCPDYGNALAGMTLYQLQQEALKNPPPPPVLPFNPPVLNPAPADDNSGTVTDYQSPYAANTPQVLGSSNNNMLLIGGAALAAVLLLKK